MAVFYRGDTLPVVVNFEDYKIQKGDEIIVGILRWDESKEEFDVLKEISTIAKGNADEVQLEFSREDTYEIFGDLVIEACLLRNGNTEKTMQKKIKLEKDGLR
jgi:hypothetical protein